MNNQEYWQKRNEQMYLNGEKDGLEVAKELKSNYEQCLARIEKELNAFYGKYAKENKISLEDAKKFINKDELKQFKRDLNEYIEYAKKHNFRNVDRGNLKSIKGKARISRLEELKTRIEFEIEKLSSESIDDFETYLSNTYEDTYYKTIFNAEQNIGFKINFNKLNNEAIQKAVSTNYNGINYSEGIWKNKDNLNYILNQAIPQGIALGYNPNKMASIVSGKLNTSYNSTVRLLRTEYNAILNEASTNGYKAAGIERYQILATLDSRTSEICRDWDGEIVDLKDKEVGINFPPFHPNCRTTTIPYFEPDEIDEEFGIGSRLAKDKKGNYYEVPANMTYKQWRESNL